MELNQKLDGKSLKWHQTLSFKTFLIIILLAVVLLAGIVAIMSVWGNRLVLDESKKLIEESGNSAVAELKSRLNEIEALARTLSESVKMLPRDEEVFLKGLPPLINFQNDTSVAGGGFWPEPFLFDAKVERRAFFWGRNHAGQLSYLDDYNQPGPGYHHEEWYVVTPHSTRGRCFWSRSYMDPYSYQPMTTCTVGLFESNRFVGNVTIDVKLEGLATLVGSWQKNERGYAFILDRQNKFLTFPDLNLVKKFAKDQRGNRTEEFLTVSEFADKNPAFGSLAAALEALNQEIKDLAKTQMLHQPHLSQEIAKSGLDISPQESDLIAAIIGDPLKVKTQKSALIREVTYDHDLLTKEKSIASIFHVPGSYWKVVIVNPLSEATYVATRFTNMMINFLGFAVILVALVAYIFLTIYVIRPLTQTTKSIQGVTLQIAKGGDVSSDFSEDVRSSENEIGILTQSFIDMTRQVVFARGAMARQTADLKVLNENLKNEQSKAIQNAKLASLGEMAAGIAHEINNPTAIISGTLAIMHSVISDPDQLRNRIKIIEKSVARITKIVGGLRKFSRTSDHSDHKVLDLRQVIEEAMTMTLSKARKNNTEIILECEPGLKILFNEIELEQIIINMIINGVDAVNNLQIRWVRLEAKSDGMHVNLFIRDSGHGIPLQHRDKIFQPFFTTKPVGQGTGLGLSIVKGLLESNQASIEICYDQEHTTFKIRFPMASDVGLDTQVHKNAS